MAVYYFHLCDGNDVLLDSEGRELEAEDVPAAAMAEARAMVAADAMSGHIFLNQKIEVRDGTGKVVHHLSFDDAVKVTHGA